MASGSAAAETAPAAAAGDGAEDSEELRRKAAAILDALGQPVVWGEIPRDPFKLRDAIATLEPVLLGAALGAGGGGARSSGAYAFGAVPAPPPTHRGELPGERGGGVPFAQGGGDHAARQASSWVSWWSSRRSWPS